MRISIYPILRIDITDFYKYFRHFTQIFSQLEKLKKRVVREIFLRTWKNSWIHLNIFVNWTNSPEKDAWAMCKEKKKYFYHN